MFFFPGPDSRSRLATPTFVHTHTRRLGRHEAWCAHARSCEYAQVLRGGRHCSVEENIARSRHPGHRALFRRASGRARHGSATFAHCVYYLVGVCVCCE